MSSMTNDERFELAWRIIIICFAVACLAAVMLYLASRENLSCSGDKCRKLQSMILENLATVLGSNHLS